MHSLFGRPVALRVMRTADRSEQRSMPITAVTVMVTLCAAATQAMGFEDVLGAFLCGIGIGQARGIDLARLAPLNTFTTTVLTPIFFATVALAGYHRTPKRPAAPDRPGRADDLLRTRQPSVITQSTSYAANLNSSRL
jgi:hypothetical protein